MAALGDRVRLMDNGKYWIRAFVRFQYGKLSEACKPHAPVFAAISRHGLTLEEVESLSKGMPKAIEGLSKATGKAIEGYPVGYQSLQEEEKDKEEDKEKEKEARPTAEQIFNAYPKKVAKQDALRAITKAFAFASPEQLLEATTAFGAATANWEDKDKPFIPHPATWFNGGRYNDDRGEWTRGGNRQEQQITLISA